MKELKLIAIVRGYIDFTSRKEWFAMPKQEKIKLINSYRKVEKETNDAIQRHGSVEKWYESGEGRIL